MSDPVVKRLVDLHEKSEGMAKEGGMIKGWRPLRFDSRGRVIAGKSVDGAYQTNDFEPVGEWKKAAEYLALGNELRSLLFSDLTPDQIDAYRVSIGLQPMQRQEKNATDTQ